MFYYAIIRRCRARCNQLPAFADNQSNRQYHLGGWVTLAGLFHQFDQVAILGAAARLESRVTLAFYTYFNTFPPGGSPNAGMASASALTLGVLTVVIVFLQRKFASKKNMTMDTSQQTRLPLAALRRRQIATLAWVYFTFISLATILLGIFAIALTASLKDNPLENRVAGWRRQLPRRLRPIMQSSP